MGRKNLKRRYGIGPEQDRLQQQIFMTSRQQVLLSLMRLQALGVTDMEIKNMAGTANGNTNNGWPMFHMLSTVDGVEV